MVEGAALNSGERARDICAGDRPRARSPPILAAMASNSASERSTPRLAADSSPPASSWAWAAEYSQWNGIEHRWRRLLQPLQTCGQPRSPAQAPPGTDPTLDPLPGPRETVRLRLTSSATLDRERPRSRAIARADRPLSGPRSIAALSARSSLL